MNWIKKVKKILLGLMAGLAITSCMPIGTLFADTVKNESIQTASQEKDSQQEQDLKLDVKGAIAIDEKTGQILFEQNADQALPVASLSKLLTLYIVMDEIKAGKLTWDQEIQPDKTTAEISQDTSLSNVPLSVDHKYTVKSLFDATLIYSANGAAMALAKAVAGSQKAFVEMMRKQASEFGIKDAEIYTCNGLSNGQLKADAYPGASANAENKFSAKDMAIISMKLLHKFPEIIKTASIKEMKFNNGNGETEMKNWNWMLPGGSSSYKLLNVDGLKTGTSDAAGACFVGTTNKDGHRIITVVLGAQHKSETDNSRFVQTQKLMSYVYHHYDYVEMASKKVSSTVPVYHGKAEDVKVQNSQPIGIWVTKGTSSSQIKGKLILKKDLLKKNQLVAPLKKDQVVGKMKLEVNDYLVKSIDSDIEVNAQVADAVEKANIFQIMWHKLTHLF